MKPPGIGPQVLVLGSIYQGFILGTNTGFIGRVPILSSHALLKDFGVRHNRPASAQPRHVLREKWPRQRIAELGDLVLCILKANELRLASTSATVGGRMEAAWKPGKSPQKSAFPCP